MNFQLPGKDIRSFYVISSYSILGNLWSSLYQFSVYLSRNQLLEGRHRWQVCSVPAPEQLLFTAWSDIVRMQTSTCNSPSCETVVIRALVDDLSCIWVQQNCIVLCTGAIVIQLSNPERIRAEEAFTVFPLQCWLTDSTIFMVLLPFLSLPKLLPLVCWALSNDFVEQCFITV